MSLCRILPRSRIIQHLSFCDWLISLSIMFSNFIHVVACGRISFFSLNNIQQIHIQIYFIFIVYIIYICLLYIYLYNIYTQHFPYPFICQWTFKSLLHLHGGSKLGFVDCAAVSTSNQISLEHLFATFWGINLAILEPLYDVSPLNEMHGSLSSSLHASSTSYLSGSGDTEQNSNTS